MGKRLITAGHSLGLIIDKSLLKLMQFTLETELEIYPYGRSLIIRKTKVPDTNGDFGEDEKVEAVQLGKKLIKAGNSSALVIDKALLDAMQFSKTTKFEILVFRKGLMIREAVKPMTKEEMRRLEKQAEAERYDPMSVFWEMQNEDPPEEPWKRLILVDGKWVVNKTKGEIMREAEERAKKELGSGD